MPELPEVETVRLQLQKEIVGLKVKGIEVRRTAMFSGDKKSIIGSEVVEIKRYGKMLVIVFSNGINLGVHLKMTGRLIIAKSQKLKAKSTDWEVDYPNDKHTHVVITFNNGSKLYFWDVRRFGWIKIISNLKMQISKLGIEPFTKEFTLNNFEKVFSGKKTAIKLMLMDQQKIAGVGNIYANDGLFCARIDPRRSAASLAPFETKKLYESIRKVLKDGIKYKGASENDFRDLYGGKGDMQEHFWVYSRAGKECPLGCGNKIVRITLGGRGTFYCPSCQK